MAKAAPPWVYPKHPRLKNAPSGRSWQTGACNRSPGILGSPGTTTNHIAERYAQTTVLRPKIT